jgi:hypothetical protein
MTAKRKWRYVTLAVVIAIACVCHAPLLRGLAGFLIVDQPTDNYDYICLSPWGQSPNGDHCYDVAAELFRKKPACRFLLIEPAPNRLEAIGAVPSFASLDWRELHARGVPQEAITILRGQRWNDWATAHALADWTRDHSGHSIVLLCGQFHSAQMRRALDDVLTPTAAATVHIHALPNRQHDDTNWWTRRSGYRAFAEGWLLRFQGWLAGGDMRQTPARTADDYERDFLHAFAEDTP